MTYTLSKESKKHRAALRKLLKSADIETFRQGCRQLVELAQSEEHCVIAQELADGCAVGTKDKKLTWVLGEEAKKRTRKANRNALASWALKVCGALKQPRELDYSADYNLPNVDFLLPFSAIGSIDLKYCYKLASLEGLSNLEKLRTLELQSCHALTSLEGLEKLTTLEELYLEDCKSLVSLMALPRSKKVTSLNLSGCQSLTSLDGIENLGALAELRLITANGHEGCPALTNIDAVGRLEKLIHLSLDCSALSNVDALLPLETLEEVQMEDKNRKTLCDIQGLKGKTTISKLCISFDILNKDVMTSLTGLKQLTLRSCWHLEDLAQIGQLAGLESLTLKGCRNLKSLDGISAFPGLERLILTDCRSLESVEDLAGLKNLKVLGLNADNFSGGGVLKEIGALANLTKLETVNLAGTAITNVDPLSKLTNLTEVRLIKCKALKDVNGLSKLPKLALVNCRKCESLSNIDGIGRLFDKAELDLTGCSRVLLDFRKKWTLRYGRFVE